MQKLNKMLSFFKKNKKYVYSALAATAGVGFCTSIYFSQTMYFYKMQNVQLQSGNSIESFNGTSEYIAKKYKRTPAKTLTDPLLPAGTDPIDFYPNFFKAQNDTSILDKIFDSTTVDTNSPNYQNSFMNDDYINNAVKTNTLMQHPAAKYMYDTYVTDDVPAVTKVINFDLQSKGRLTTGLFLPPGEIIELNFPGMTDEQVKELGLKIEIGASEPMNAGKDYYIRYNQRMPNIIKDIAIDSANFRYGTPFGGLVSIENYSGSSTLPNNVVIQFDNAVETLHYVHGETSEKEWKRLLKEAKAPVFDFRSDTIQFLGQNYWLTSERKTKMTDLPYPYKVIELYRKMGADSLKSLNRRNMGQQPIRMYYSNYVSNKDGSALAVSIVGQWYVTNDRTMCVDLLNYDNYFKNGSWGNNHEYNHQLQVDNMIGGYWGFGNFIEVSNNTLNVMNYLNYLNYQSDRTTPDKINYDHEWKKNGFTSVQKLNEQKDKSTLANEAAYMAYLFLMGAESYQKTLMTVNDPSFEIPDLMHKKDINGTFVYRISKTTGYNWIDFYSSLGLLDKALIPWIDNQENEPYGPNVTPLKYLTENTDITSLPKIHPAYSFYAAETSYDSNNNFKEVARPFKVSGSEPTTLKIQEYTNTNDKLYSLSNFQLVSQPKYGKIQETNNNGKIEYIYTPNSKYKNNLDEFIYKVTSTQKNDQNKATNSSDVYFKVQLFQDSGKYVWQSPNGEKDNIVLPEKRENISKDIIDINNVKIYDVKDGQPELNPESTKIAYKMFDGDYDVNHGWESTVEIGNIQVEIPLKQNVSLNTFTINFRRFQPSKYENPTDFEIFYNDKGKWKSATKSKTIWGNTNQLHEFPEIKTNKLLIDFSFIENNSINNKKRFNIVELDFGKKVVPSSLIVPDSNLLRIRGDWREGFGYGKINSKSLFTIFAGSQVEFAFEGTSFYISGAKDKNYGSFDVYVDGKKVDSVSTKSSSRLNDETLYLSNQYENKKHNVKIVSSSAKPIELSYFAINGIPSTVDTPDLFYLYTVGIPLISLTVIAAIAIPTIIVLKKKKC